MSASQKKPRKNASELPALVYVRVSDELRSEIQRQAENSPGGMSGLIREAVANHIGRPELGCVSKEAA